MKDTINWQWHHFDDLTTEQAHDMFALRQEVFILEQDCIYQDIDGKDKEAYHLLGWQDKKLVATLRVFESYQPYFNNASLGRVCTHQSVRRYGLGKELVQRAIIFIQENFPNKAVQIGAQHYLKKFYDDLGFRQISDIYDEDGIDHILMIKDNAS